MTMRLRTIGVLLLILAACSTGRNTRDGRRGNIDVITQATIIEHGFVNAYDAVQALHSNWLRTRGPDSFSTPSTIVVYYDSNRLGGVETLRQITPGMIAYIQWFNGIDATRRWGLDHGAGVIFVSSVQ